MDLNGRKIGFLESIEIEIEKFLVIFLPEKTAKTAVQFCKCSLVGASNTLVDLAVLNLLIFITSIDSGIYIAIFAGVSFIIADINSFLWNKFWTFRDKKKTPQELSKQIFKFLCISLGGLAINVLTVQVIVNVVGHQWGIKAALWANIAKICAIFLTIIWNFTGYKLVVFKN